MRSAAGYLDGESMRDVICKMIHGYRGECGGYAICPTTSSAEDWDLKSSQ